MQTKTNTINQQKNATNRIFTAKIIAIQQQQTLILEYTQQRFFCTQIAANLRFTTLQIGDDVIASATDQGVIILDKIIKTTTTHNQVLGVIEPKQFMFACGKTSLTVTNTGELKFCGSQSQLHFQSSGDIKLCGKQITQMALADHIIRGQNIYLN